MVANLFSKKDLGLILPEDATLVDPSELKHIKTADETTVFVPLVPKVDLSKRISRHRAGQKPKCYFTEEEENATTCSSKREKAASASFLSAPTQAPRARPKIQATIISKAPVMYNQSSNVTSASASSRSEPPTTNIFDESDDSEDSDVVDTRRAKLRARLLEKANDPIMSSSLGTSGASFPPPPSMTKTTPGSASDEGSESTEWETDSDDSVEDTSATDTRLRPVFVPKAARDTIARAEELERQAEATREAEIDKRARRKAETKQLVSAEVTREALEAASVAREREEDMPEDTDDVDPEAEYKAWEVREMKRILRTRAKREARVAEEAETVRRRDMTEEQRCKEDAALGKGLKEDKGEWKFLQKFHHKGAFYMDDASLSVSDVRTRDISGATHGDHYDKESMPKVMQVKNFGRSGQTKYTHLADQDTSTRGDLWQQDDAIRTKFRDKSGGVGSIDDAGRARKRRK